jgi:outer membrane protein TolC
MDSMRQVAKAETEFIQLAEKNLAYMQERQKIGEGNALEIKIASQELEVARMNHKKILDGQRKIKESIRTFMAWPANQELSFDLSVSRIQLLGNFESPTEAAESITSSTFDFKIQALKRELQKYNISLAKTKLLPTFYLGVVTPDPLSGLQSNSFFTYGGAFVPLWDGFKRVRNITRQKTVLKQLDAEANATENNFIEKWREGQENLADAATQLKMSQSQLELAMLKAKQLEVRYHQFGEPFSIYLEGEKGIVEAKKNILMKTLEYDQARLTLRYLANDLVSQYVNENSLPKRSEDK